MSERIGMTVRLDEIKLEFEYFVEHPLRAAVAFRGAADQVRTPKQMFRYGVKMLYDGGMRRKRGRRKVEKGEKIVVDGWEVHL
jgi:hypothetical protein